MGRNNDQDETAVAPENEVVDDQQSEVTYTEDEKERAIDVIKMLIKVRDRARKEGLINW